MYFSPFTFCFHLDIIYWWCRFNYQGPVVQSVVSLRGSLRVMSLTVLADSIYNILIFFAEKMFFRKKFQHICVSLDVNFNESLTNDVVSFEQLGPEFVVTLPCFLLKSYLKLQFKQITHEIELQSKNSQTGAKQFPDVGSHCTSCGVVWPQTLSLFFLLFLFLLLHFFFFLEGTQHLYSL